MCLIPCEGQIDQLRYSAVNGNTNKCVPFLPLLWWGSGCCCCYYYYCNNSVSESFVAAEFILMEIKWRIFVAIDGEG